MCTHSRRQCVVPCDRFYWWVYINRRCVLSTAITFLACLPVSLPRRLRKPGREVCRCGVGVWPVVCGACLPSSVKKCDVAGFSFVSVRLLLAMRCCVVRFGGDCSPTRLPSLGRCLHGIVNSKLVFCRRLLEIHLPLGIDVRESRLMRSKVHGQEINA